MAHIEAVGLLNRALGKPSWETVEANGKDYNSSELDGTPKTGVGWALPFLRRGGAWLLFPTPTSLLQK